MSNRLAQAQSLYLRKHADNPIDWWPWCEEALAKARQENKPIFLSIGYSSCHWCTVMEGEAFSDPDVAEYMNANYVAIKVDREERPDLDSIYMQTLQLLTGQGGWPLNVFLSPDDLVPFYGGTYFPQQPKFNRPGFVQVLQALRRFYEVEGEKLATVKGEVLQRLQQLAGEIAEGGELHQALLRRGLDYSTGVLAARGMGPNFPMIPYAAAALRDVRFSGLSGDETTYDAATLCRQRGLELALGGIYDHVGGGFHRYTVDGTWTVPHFEKMLYDNGQIVEFLADLWAMGAREPAFERAVAGTVQWLQREMTAPAGYFYAAQDADSFGTPDQPEPEEGTFYVWSYAELEQQLTADELAELTQQFTVTQAGNFEGANVLQRYSGEPLSPQLEGALAKLFGLRYGSEAASDPAQPFPPARNSSEAKTRPWPARIPPVTDPKMIVAWNSLMISGLARAATAFQQLEYLNLASRAARFILDHQAVEGRLHRINYEGQPSVMAQSEDYALLIKALLDLQQAALAFQQDAEFWLAAAVRLQGEFDQFLWSDDQGGYYNTDARNDLVIRERNYGDNATPSANGIAAMNLVRLFLNTEEIAYLNRSEQTLLAFSAVMQNTPQTCPTLFSALDWFLHMTLVRTGPEQVEALAAQYLPAAQYRVEALPIGAVALVCQGLSCLAPAGSEAELQTQLGQSLVRSV
ncbi:MAG: thioredoxin domain-containing protein [Elainella sp.]